MSNYLVGDLIARTGIVTEREKPWIEPSDVVNATRLYTPTLTGKVTTGTIVQPPYDSMWIEVGIDEKDKAEDELPVSGRGVFVRFDRSTGTVTLYGFLTATWMGFGVHPVRYSAELKLNDAGELQNIRVLGDELYLEELTLLQESGHGDIKRLHAAALADNYWDAIYALALMNCKNIDVVDLHRPKPVLRVGGKRVPVKVPRLTFKTILVPGFGRPSEKGAVDGQNRDLAWHLVRGHFATYTEDAPLFGRLTGTYWKPAHVRGEKRNGIVTKDYEVGHE